MPKRKKKYDLRKRTPDETFWVWRRSLDLTQEEAAKVLGWTKKRYWLIETGRQKISEVPKPVTTAYAEIGVMCGLARRRSGKRIQDVAEMLGISHVTLILWERDNDERLVAAWRDEGYSFGNPRLVHPSQLARVRARLSLPA